MNKNNDEFPDPSKKSVERITNLCNAYRNTKKVQHLDKVKDEVSFLLRNSLEQPTKKNMEVYKEHVARVLKEFSNNILNPKVTIEGDRVKVSCQLYGISRISFNLLDKE